MPTGCAATYILDNEVCHRSSKDCEPEELTSGHGNDGEKTYDTNDNDYGDCVIGTCKTGYIKDGDSCRAPERNKYIDANGQEQDCTGSISSYAGFLGGKPVIITDPKKCPVTCHSGYVKDGRDCRLPKENKYTDADGNEHDCIGTVSNGDLGGDTVIVTDPEKCPILCFPSHVKDGRNCRPPRRNKYIDFTGQEKNCVGTVSNGYLGGKGGAYVTDPKKCPVTCHSGYVKDGRDCRPPQINKYATSQGIERPCNLSVPNSATLGGEAVVVKADDQCPFTCNVGYIKDGRQCRRPHAKKYLDAHGDEQNCNNVVNSATLGGEPKVIASSDQCSFICNPGYTVDGRSCTTSLKFEAIVAKSHLCALLEGGAVRCWGDTQSDYSKTQDGNIDLGGTATAISVGHDYTCAILTGGTVKCWGDE